MRELIVFTIEIEARGLYFLLAGEDPPEVGLKWPGDEVLEPIIVLNESLWNFLGDFLLMLLEGDKEPLLPIMIVLFLTF